jgi:hypothetical protein
MDFYIKILELLSVLVLFSFSREIVIVHFKALIALLLI